MKSILAGIAGAMLATAGLAAEPPSSAPSYPSDTGAKKSETKKLGSTDTSASKSSFTSEASAKDLAAIKEVATNVAKAFNDGDAKAAAKYFTQDARVYNPKGKQASGRDDIERLIKEDL